MRLLPLLFLCALAPVGAMAQCNPQSPGGFPFNCSDGGSPQPNDLFAGGSKNGATVGDTVTWTGDAVVRMDHTNSPVRATNGPVKSLGDWMAQLNSLGSGTGGSGGASGLVNQGSGNSLAYYTTTGTAVSGLPTQPGGVLVTDTSGIPQIGTSLPSGLTIPNPKFTGTVTGLPSGAGSGTVNTGSANSLAYYASAGAAVAGLTMGNNGVLVTSASGVPSIATTLPSGLTIPNPTFTGTVTGLPAGGGGGTTGTINSALANQIAFYGASGTTVSGIATDLNGVLVTDGTVGIPSISHTLPAGLTMQQPAINGPVTLSGTGSSPFMGDAADFTVNDTGNSTTAANMYNGLLACGNCYNHDVVRSVSTVPTGSKVYNTNGFASYIINNNASGSNNQNAVGLFSVGFSNADGAETWGINTNLSDSTSQTTAQNSLVNRVLANELDFNVMSNQTTVYGMVLQGGSRVKPKASSGFMVSPLSLLYGSFTWDQAFISQNNAADVAFFVGTKGAVLTSGGAPVANLNSQPIAFITTDGNGTQQVSQLQAQPDGIIFTSTLKAPQIILTSANSPGSGNGCSGGQVTWDGGFIYLCIASGHWKRATLNDY